MEPFFPRPYCFLLHKSDLGIDHLPNKDFLSSVRLRSPEEYRDRQRLHLLYKIANDKLPGKSELLRVRDAVEGRTRLQIPIRESNHPMPLDSTYPSTSLLKDSFKHSWLFSSLKIWNNLPLREVDLESLSNFRWFLYRYFQSVR